MSLKRKSSRQNIFVSSGALLVGITLVMNPFFAQAEAHNRKLSGATRSDDQTTPVVHPKLWPESKSPIVLDAKIEKRIDALLQRMTVEEKVGQVVQPEWKSITPAEVAQYHIGTIENGGGAVPGGRFSKGFRASNAAVVPERKAWPWNWSVPGFVRISIRPYPSLSYSAEKGF